jgi:FkbM family methyltransferase
VFDRALLYRETGALMYLAAPRPLDEQYFPPDVPFLGSRMRYVDAGAYTGDTIRALRQRGSDVEALIALEPDPQSFSLLSSEAKKFFGTDIAVLALPLGLSDKTDLLTFSGDGTAAASITSDGACVIQCVALDDVALSWRPTHIKMDIEGAEMSALAGMTSILRTYRPALAISAYHRPQDLWSLLLHIKNLDLGYEFRMRAYGHQTFDTVLYCSPLPERPMGCQAKVTLE